jgi:hypothetical protein
VADTRLLAAERAKSRARIKAWLDAPAPAAAALPPFTLLPSEQALLAAHLSLGGNGHELRQVFNCTRELLEQAVAGEHLAAEVVERVRLALTNGAAG